MIDVSWAVKGRTKRSDIIRVVVEAAERYLEEEYPGPEDLHSYMSQSAEQYERGRRERRCTDRSEEGMEDADAFEDDC